jgi:catechol 2,3-dioxygenase-like lactoylglutathione lyase family enzyme
MAIKRMDNVSIVVEDLKAVIAFFVELGLELEGEGTIEEDWADRIMGLENHRVDIAMMRTPDGHSKLELMQYLRPKAVALEPAVAPVNALGIRRLLFAVDDIADVLTRLQAMGAELIGEVTDIGDSFRMCYLRGPEGLIVALAEELG